MAPDRGPVVHTGVEGPERPPVASAS